MVLISKETHTHLYKHTNKYESVKVKC